MLKMSQICTKVCSNLKSVTRVTTPETGFVTREIGSQPDAKCLKHVPKWRASRAYHPEIDEKRVLEIQNTQNNDHIGGLDLDPIWHT